MANAKISELTSATTPLAGTETLPIVQAGATVKVANNDLRPKQIQANATSGVLQITGPAAASTRVMTTPDSNFTVARTDAGQTFTGSQIISGGNLTTGQSIGTIAYQTIQSDSGVANAKFAAYQAVRSNFDPTGVAAEIGFYRGSSGANGSLAFATNPGTSTGQQPTNRMTIGATGLTSINGTTTLGSLNVKDISGTTYTFGIEPASIDALGSAASIGGKLTTNGGEKFIQYEVTNYNNSANFGTGIRFYTRTSPSTVSQRMLISSAGDVTLNTGNLIQGTAAKGFNFTANTPVAGMTSQLLNWYEEGTWTPNQGTGLTLVGAFSSTGRYTRIGRQVSISGTVTGATTVALAAAGVITSNLPFTVVTAGHGDATNVAVDAAATVICTGTSVTSAGAIAATATITFSATYFV
jgi:hypothetical protein